jgi:hypothetical protein
VVAKAIVSAVASVGFAFGVLGHGFADSKGLLGFASPIF